MFPTLLGFDVDELRRRRALAESMEAPAPNAQVERPLTPAEENFNRIATAPPNEENYKPSLLRNILAGVAGFGAGYNQGPMAGLQTTEAIRRLPFTRAQATYEQNLQNAQNPLELEFKRRAESQKQQDLNAQSTNAHANLINARSGVMWRPQTKEETLEVEGLRHPARSMSAEEIKMRFFAEDPKGFAEYMRLQRADPNSLTFEQRTQLEEIQGRIARQNASHQGAITRGNQEHLANVQAALRPIEPESPVSETQRERMAIERVLRLNPQYKEYIEEVETPQGTYMRIKRPDEIRGVFRRWTSQDSTKYERFLETVGLEKTNLRSIGHRAYPPMGVGGLEE